MVNDQGLSPTETLDTFGVTHDLLISKDHFLSIIQPLEPQEFWFYISHTCKSSAAQDVQCH